MPELRKGLRLDVLTDVWLDDQGFYRVRLLTVVGQDAPAPPVEYEPAGATRQAINRTQTWFEVPHAAPMYRLNARAPGPVVTP